MVKNKLIIIIFTILLLTLLGCSQQNKITNVKETGIYVGSLQSNKYHYPSCEWAKKIKTNNEIWFADTAEAKAKGYVPCGVCKP